MTGQGFEDLGSNQDAHKLDTMAGAREEIGQSGRVINVSASSDQVARKEADQVAGQIEKILKGNSPDAGEEALNKFYTSFGREIYHHSDPATFSSNSVFANELVDRLNTQGFWKNEKFQDALRKDIETHKGDNADNLKDIAQGYVQKIADYAAPAAPGKPDLAKAADETYLAIGTSWWNYGSKGLINDFDKYFSTGLQDTKVGSQQTSLVDVLVPALK